MFSQDVLIDWNIVLPLYFSILAILFKEKAALRQKEFSSRIWLTALKSSRLEEPVLKTKRVKMRNVSFHPHISDIYLTGLLPPKVDICAHSQEKQQHGSFV